MSFNPFGTSEIKSTENVEMPKFEAFGKSETIDNAKPPSFGEFGSFSTTNNNDTGKLEPETNKETNDFPSFSSFSGNTDEGTESFGSFGSFETETSNVEFGSFESTTKINKADDFKFDMQFSNSPEKSIKETRDGATEMKNEINSFNFKSDFQTIEKTDNNEFGSFSHGPIENASKDTQDFSLKSSENSVLSNALNAVELKDVGEISKISFDPIQDKISIPKPVPFKDSPIAAELVQYTKSVFGHEYKFITK